MSIEDVEQALREARAKLVDARFKAGAGALKKVHEIGLAKKTIARLQTKRTQLAVPHVAPEERAATKQADAH